MNPRSAQPDQTLDRILTALRDTPAPTGLNQRITARIAQAQTEPQRSSLTPRSWQLAVRRWQLTARSRQLAAGRPNPSYRQALTAIALLALALFALHYRPSPPAQPNTTTAVQSNPSTPATTTDAASNLRAEGPPDTTVRRSPTFASTTTRGPQARSIASTPASTDLDALALAETLAPSHPATPMPLTAEEHLLVLATRQGQPMELAELETLRQPALQAAAEARQQATLRNYVHSLLAPLAAAEAINPTSPTEAASTSQPPSR
jgi:hypothetical protein